LVENAVKPLYVTLKIKEKNMILKRSGGFEARDPSVTYYNGRYYHCYSTGNAELIKVASAESLEKLGEAEGVTVFTPEENKPYSRELWAPELHIIGERPYVYFAADDGDNKNHRMYVLEGESSDPQGKYRFTGRIFDKTNKWAIDGTVMQYGGELYMIWSGWEGDINICQNLYIAKMSDPCTISSERVMISTPEYDWEKMDCTGLDRPFINEGPFVYTLGEKTYLFYSGSGSWANHYCIGLLELVGTDPMCAENWKKQPYPALSLDDGYNGPGHCSLFSDGKSDYVAFHSFDEGRVRGWNRVHATVVPFTLENGKIKITL
jgi:GH43 family beta-xylosidase